MFPDVSNEETYRPMTKPNILQVRHKVLGTIGICFVGFGIVLSLSWPHLFQFILHKQLVITPGSETFNIWKDPPVPIYMNFYFYNWTNPEKLGSEKPKLIELGPYRFIEKDEKTGVVWNENGTITYQRQRKWYFDQERSNGSLDDQITTLNPVALSAANSVKYWTYLMKKSLSMTISSSKQKVHVTHSVGDLLFYGYSDPLLDFAKKLPSFAGVDIPYDKFGWFYLRNGSDTFEGVFNMDTGVNDISQFGKLHNWNYNNYTPFYEDSCGFVKGTAGEIFHPEQKKTEDVEMFSADLCRSISLKYSEEVEMYGISGNKYIGREDIVDNGTLDTSNECFCDGECVPSGVINVTSCRLGAPGFISFPHFYLADPYFSEQVEGMSPDPLSHTLYLVLEPTTGIPLDVAARFQINLLLSPQPSISLYQNVPRIFFPMIWFEQRATISEDLAFILRIVLNLPNVGQAISLIMLTTGLLVLVVYVYFICRHQHRDDEIPIDEISKQNDDIKMYESTVSHPLILPVKGQNVEKNPELVPCIK